MANFKEKQIFKSKKKYGIAKKAFFTNDFNLSIYSPKERRIKELYPKYEKSEIMQILSSTESRTEENLTLKPKKSTNNSPKKMKIENFTRSNIFNDSSNKSFNDENLYIDSNKFLHSNNLDWKKDNTEIIFRGDVKKEKINEKAYQPLKMKLKELYSHLDNRKTDFNKIEVTKKKIDFRFNQLKEINQNYNNSNTNGHFNKFKQSISNLHPKNFYKNAILGKNFPLIYS